MKYYIPLLASLASCSSSEFTGIDDNLPDGSPSTTAAVPGAASAAPGAASAAPGAASAAPGAASGATSTIPDAAPNVSDAGQPDSDTGAEIDSGPQTPVFTPYQYDPVDFPEGKPPILDQWKHGQGYHFYDWFQTKPTCTTHIDASKDGYKVGFVEIELALTPLETDDVELLYLCVTPSAWGENQVTLFPHCQPPKSTGIAPEGGRDTSSPEALLKYTVRHMQQYGTWIHVVRSPMPHIPILSFHFEPYEMKCSFELRDRNNPDHFLRGRSAQSI